MKIRFGVTLRANVPYGIVNEAVQLVRVRIRAARLNVLDGAIKDAPTDSTNSN
jgi:hypothetical protein